MRGWIEFTEVLLFVKFEVRVWICWLCWEILGEQEGGECGLFKGRKLRGTYLGVEGVCGKRESFEIIGNEKVEKNEEK